MPIKREMMVRRDALTQVAVNETLAPEPGEGEILLQIEAFAVTANTVTYGVVGAQIGYWNFFPAPEGWGIVPAWGYARVVASRVADIAVGERVYGFLPMASHLIVQPGKISAGLFRDMAAHRQPMSAVYNQYRRLQADPAHDAAREDLRMLFEPLFLTSFLIEDTLRRAGWYGTDTVVLTSASSKTALGTAYVLREGSPQIRRIGLTSAAHVGFVEKTGLYDAVLAYDAINGLGSLAEAVLIDFAGNAALLQAAYAALPDRVAQCLRVGVTHHDAGGETALLPDPKPVWFFAPNAATALIGEIGQEGFNAAVAAQWTGFVAVAAGLIHVEHGQGIEALQRIWRTQVAGQAAPDTGFVVRL
ncbi:hypothetical protein J2X47_003316 [Sphingomonas sp. BE270]|jgi:hypothetical protein|uniref:DUF2855 family protein n=1 Tax=unclassified Sphingomonas TaxID=196159 RepID=UPI0010F7058A|nr:MULTISPECIES: DUF2855 family protein [unclassified Sphingomonas]MDR6848458.1 hypothetical protein [Sphingomonas sp. BE137]MDR7259120.1 hypothetical protein [Sphingomonas sp. BE270]